MDMIIGIAVMLALPGYLALQLYTATRWRGGWRIAALAPLLVMAPVVLHATIAFMAQSNLWPVLAILTAPLACLYLTGLAGARALQH